MNPSNKRCPRFSLRLAIATAVATVGALALAARATAAPSAAEADQHPPGRPNIVLILADDIGYGDLGCYGATRIKTPHLDRLAQEGLRFTDGHCTSGTCTPSRFSLMTGRYAWRYRGTQILPGDAPLIIESSGLTLPNMLRGAGYRTACVGKWHLGLGTGAVNWNGEIRPGPLELGFDYAFILPATGDRTPCVYLENHRVVNLDPADPISVSYVKRVGDEPTGRDHPELLKMKLSHGHADTIVNGISRIGFMAGGKAARWVDEDMADTFAQRAVGFIERSVAAQSYGAAKADGSTTSDEAAKSAAKPFFLYLATHDAHVPRVPNARFAGSSGCGVRGDVVQEFDDTVGQVLAALDRLGIADNTLVIATSDNGPVLDDGYDDGAVQDASGHRPAGPWRGGKYSKYEGGTRVPFLARWPARIKPGVSAALVCQVDFLASLAELVGADVSQTPLDSLNLLPVLLGQSVVGRETLVEQEGGPEGLAFRKGNWKLVPKVKIRRGALVNSSSEQPKVELYNLADDPGETRDLSAQRPELARQLMEELLSATKPLQKLPPSGGKSE